jgi:hypothetical protein
MTRENYNLHLAYTNVFRSADGRMVLKDLLKTCGHFVTGESLPPEAIIAKRQVGTHILSRLGAFTPTNLDAQIELYTGLTPIGPGEVKESE